MNMAAASYLPRILSTKYGQTSNVKPLTSNCSLPFAVKWPNLDLKVSIIIFFKTCTSRASSVFLPLPPAPPKQKNPTLTYFLSFFSFLILKHSNTCLGINLGVSGFSLKGFIKNMNISFGHSFFTLTRCSFFKLRIQSFFFPGKRGI